jgi:threonine dehydrogenase-like Zn-dependent dehydrogenase
MDVAKLAPVEMASCVAANMIDLAAINAIRGKRVGVMGLGPAGIIAAQMMRAEGAAEIIGLDIDERRRSYALAKGIVNRAINPAGEDGKALPFRAREDRNALIEIGIDCAGFPAALQYLMDHTRDIVTIFALQHGPVSFMGRPPGHHAALKLFGYPGRDFACGNYAARAVAKGEVDLSLTISHTMRLEEYGRAMQLIETQQALKVMFTFDERDW